MPASRLTVDGSRYHLHQRRSLLMARSPLILPVVVLLGAVAFVLGSIEPYPIPALEKWRAWPLVVMLGGLLVAREFAERELVRLEEQRARLFSAMLRAEEEERGRIATDLHDDTVQVMVASLMRIDLAKTTADPKTAERLEAVRDALREAVERTRHVMFELRPMVLEHKGLCIAAAELVRVTAEEMGADYEWDCRLGRHGAGLEALIFRTVREVLNNVRTHSQATRLRVSLWEADNGNVIEGLIADNGRGFDLGEAIRRSRERVHKHLGLPAVTERIELAGGVCRITTRPGRGCRVRFSLPVHALGHGG